MGYILITRNPRTGRLLAIVDDKENVAEFGTRDEAVEAADNTTVCKAWNYQILETED